MNAVEQSVVEQRMRSCVLRAWSSDSLDQGHAHLSAEFMRILKATVHTKVKVEKVTYCETKFSSISLRPIDWSDSQAASPKVTPLIVMLPVS